MSASVKIEHELTKLNAALAMYVRASGMAVGDVFQKKGAQLGYALKSQFKGLMPAKGEVRAQRIAALKAGEGIKVRESARRFAANKFGATDLKGNAVRANKRGTKLDRTIRWQGLSVNVWQLAVMRELAIRESARGFTATSARFAFGQVGGARGEAKDYKRALSRYGPLLSTYAFEGSTKGGAVQFRFGGFGELSDDVVKALGRTRGQSAIANAVSAVTQDMIPYLERKLGEAATGLLK